MCVGMFWVSEFFKSGPCQGRRQAPPGGNAYQNGSQPNDISNVDFVITLVLKGQKNLPLSTLNKRSLWESLFRPRTRPPKCATPYFKACDFFNSCCKLTPTWPLRCTPPRVHVAAYCTVPTTPANPKRAPKRLLATLNRDGAFAAAYAASDQRRCR